MANVCWTLGIKNELLFPFCCVRHHDAGVLSVGIDPNWKHIVPPGQRRVVSEAHCVADCTQQALPSRGINVFAVNQHTHLLGMLCFYYVGDSRANRDCI